MNLSGHPATLQPSSDFFKDQPITCWKPPSAQTSEVYSAVYTAVTPSHPPGFPYSSCFILGHTQGLTATLHYCPFTPRCTGKVQANMNQCLAHFFMSLFMITHPPAEETLLNSTLRHKFALLLASVTYVFEEETFLMVDLTTLIIVTSQLCSIALLLPPTTLLPATITA